MTEGMGVLMPLGLDQRMGREQTAWSSGSSVLLSEVGWIWAGDPRKVIPLQELLHSGGTVG